MGADFHLAQPELADLLLTELYLIKDGRELSLLNDYQAVFTEANRECTVKGCIC